MGILSITITITHGTHDRPLGSVVPLVRSVLLEYCRVPDAASRFSAFRSSAAAPSGIPRIAAGVGCDARAPCETDFCRRVPIFLNGFERLHCFSGVAGRSKGAHFTALSRQQSLLDGHQAAYVRRSLFSTSEPHTTTAPEKRAS